MLERATRDPRPESKQSTNWKSAEARDRCNKYENLSTPEMPKGEKKAPWASQAYILFV